VYGRTHFMLNLHVLGGVLRGTSHVVRTCMRSAMSSHAVRTTRCKPPITCTRQAHLASPIQTARRGLLVINRNRVLIPNLQSGI